MKEIKELKKAIKGLDECHKIVRKLKKVDSLALYLALQEFRLEAKEKI